MRGTLGRYPIPQYRKKNWQIPKYRVENRRNTDTAFMFVYSFTVKSKFFQILT